MTVRFFEAHLHDLLSEDKKSPTEKLRTFHRILDKAAKEHSLDLSPRSDILISRASKNLLFSGIKTKKVFVGGRDHLPESKGVHLSVYRDRTTGTPVGAIVTTAHPHSKPPKAPRSSIFNTAGPAPAVDFPKTTLYSAYGAHEMFGHEMTHLDDLADEHGSLGRNKECRYSEAFAKDSEHLRMMAKMGSNPMPMDENFYREHIEAMGLNDEKLGHLFSHVTSVNEPYGKQYTEFERQKVELGKRNYMHGMATGDFRAAVGHMNYNSAAPLTDSFHAATNIQHGLSHTPAYYSSRESSGAPNIRIAETLAACVPSALGYHHSAIAHAMHRFFPNMMKVVHDHYGTTAPTDIFH